MSFVYNFKKCLRVYSYLSQWCIRDDGKSSRDQNVREVAIKKRIQLCVPEMA